MIKSKKKLVFCIECSFCKEIDVGDEYLIYECENELAWFVTETPIKMSYNKICEDLNENNDCKFFKQKEVKIPWYKKLLGYKK